MDTTQLTSPSPIEVGQDAEDEGGGDGDRVPALAQHGLVSADDLREMRTSEWREERGELQNWRSYGKEKVSLLWGKERMSY